MQRRTFLKNTIFISAGWIILPPFVKGEEQHTPGPENNLDSNFLNPPFSARPWCIWHWVNGNVTKGGITLDMEAMKRMGIGGAVCTNGIEGIPAGPIIYGSESWLQLTEHAASEAKRLGLQLVLQYLPGNNGASRNGFEPLSTSSQKIIWAETSVQAGNVDLVLPEPAQKGPGFRHVLVVAYPAAGPAGVIDAAKVVNITKNKDENGRLQWNAPGGQWVILNIGITPEINEGTTLLQPDVLSKKALDTYFNDVLEKLLNRLKPYTSGQGTNEAAGFTGIALAPGFTTQSWTEDFSKLFEENRGYDLVKWLPALAGHTVNSAEETEKFLRDVAKVKEHLLKENFFDHFISRCRSRGIDVYTGTINGLGFPDDSLKLNASSIAQPNGKKVAAAAFTNNLANSKWTAYPYSLKAGGDYLFSSGINQLLLHTFVHQPHTTVKPGMTISSSGINIDRNNTWAGQAYSWTAYLQRTQHLLQQGLFVADVLYFKGDGPESSIAPMNTWLPAGFKGQVVDANTLYNDCKIEEGKIVLRDGTSYRLCVMAPAAFIEKKTLERLMQLVNAGMVLLVNSKPAKSFGLKDNNGEIQKAVDTFFGNLNGSSVTERNYGKGKIFWGRTTDAVLKGLVVGSDFSYTAQNTDAVIHFVHKQTTDAHIYFLSNHNRKEELISASFRVQGYVPEIWNSETGEQYNAVLFDEAGGNINLPLVLSPAGSLFVIFRRKGSAAYNRLLQGGRQILHTGEVYKRFDPTDYYFYKNTFRVMLWAKPDAYANSGQSMLIHPPEGEVVYGARNAAIGLSAGLNGIRVYERIKGPAREVLFAEQKLEGWTHISLEYNEGVPSIFINGKLAATGKKSSYTVWPILNVPPAAQQYTSFFEGNFTKPALIDNLLPANEVQFRYKAGLPPLLLPTRPQLTGKGGRLLLLAWKDGTYKLEGKSSAKELTIAGCKQIGLPGSWTVNFPAGSGAPAQITLPQLQSLHLHPNSGIKYFSGTATYRKAVLISTAYLAPGNKIYLHLGRVEVVAEVKVNGRNAGIVWKEPYMLEITPFVRGGNNQLEIVVSNLWPNRLIGDKDLPEENTYTKEGNITAPPLWYVNNRPKPGKRVTFSMWDAYDKDSPLLASGLLGPVNVLVAVEKEFA